jgi:hypothetical protein
MSLTDIMSHSDLSVYPQVALVIFLSVFAITAARSLFSPRRANDARHAGLPLDDGARASQPATQEQQRAK